MTYTRPNIANAVGIVARFQANPKETHLEVVKNFQIFEMNLR